MPDKSDLLKWGVIGGIALIGANFLGVFKDKGGTTTITTGSGSDIVNTLPKTDRIPIVQFWGINDEPFARKLAAELGAGLIRTDALNQLPDSSLLGRYRVVCVGGSKINPLVQSLFGDPKIGAGWACIDKAWANDIWCVYGYSAAGTSLACDVYASSPYISSPIPYKFNVGV